MSLLGVAYKGPVPDFLRTGISLFNKYLKHRAFPGGCLGLSRAKIDLARELDNGDGICGGLVLPFWTFPIWTYRDRGGPGKTRVAPLPPPGAAPAVSMVRPVCGLDNFCEETLESSFRLDYPGYEIIFCVARANDPVLPLVQCLIARHPGRPTQVIVGDEQVSPNPKLNNCVRGWDAARHDWIILADANVLMPKDYIQRLLASRRRRTGLACSMPLGSRPRNPGPNSNALFSTPSRHAGNIAPKPWERVSPRARTCCGGAIHGSRRRNPHACRRDRGGRRLEPSWCAAKGSAYNLVDSPFEQPLRPSRFSRCLAAAGALGANAAQNLSSVLCA